MAFQVRKEVTLGGIGGSAPQCYCSKMPLASFPLSFGHSRREGMSIVHGVGARDEDGSKGGD